LANSVEGGGGERGEKEGRRGGGNNWEEGRRGRENNWEEGNEGQKIDSFMTH